MRQPKSQSKSRLSGHLGKTVSTLQTRGAIGPRSEATLPSSSRIRIRQTLWHDQEAVYRNPNGSDVSSIMLAN